MRRFILVGFLVLLFAGCSGEQSKTADEARLAFETYVAALNSGDMSKAASMYDSGDGFHWIERGGVQYETGEEAAASLLDLSARGGKPRMTVDSLRVAELADGAALVSAHFDFAMLSDEGDQQFAFDGWMTVGMVKRKEGWRIAGGQTGPGLTD